MEDLKIYQNSEFSGKGILEVSFVLKFVSFFFMGFSGGEGFIDVSNFFRRKSSDFVVFFKGNERISCIFLFRGVSFFS